MPRLFELVLGASLAACGGASDPDLGSRSAPDDHMCPPERPLAYQPTEMERARAAGCTPAWTEGARLKPAAAGQTPRRMLIACCPAR